MKKLISFITCALISTQCLAISPYTPINQSKRPIPVNTAPTNWMSPNSSSTYYIQTGSPMTITVKVNSNSAAGATLSNCSAARGISPGSGTVCNVMNPRAPVGISSSSSTASAMGTYQIRPR